MNTRKMYKTTYSLTDTEINRLLRDGVRIYYRYIYPNDTPEYYLCGEFNGRMYPGTFVDMTVDKLKRVLSV